MWFTILGAVSARRNGAEVDLGPPQQRVLLALLLAAAGRTVSLDRIVAAMWDDDPPPSASNAVYRAVGMLRRALEPDRPARAPGRYVLAQADGYRIVVDAGTFDLLKFRELAAREQIDAYAEALALWTDDVVEGVPPRLRNHPAFTALDAEHRLIAADAADLALATGTAATVLPGLRQAAAGAVFDEPLQARLVGVLAATGRQADALATYAEVVRRLADELGIDPGPELTAARDAVLGPVPPRADPLVPAQLPAGLAVFAARGAGLAGVAETIGQRGGDVAIVVVTGIAGVGKSTFAVHLAHRIADRFPDGVLHLDLRGFDPSGRVMSAAEALHVLLTSIGVPMADMPPGEDALGALLRTRTAGRRILMVLDNVRDSAQVRPLLPAGGGCAVVVTSRNQLADLVITHDALPVPLGPLVYGEARELLTRRLGANRLAADPAAVDGIIRRCAGLPLALAVVAGRAALYPDFPLAAIAAELHAADGTLDGFTGSADATDVRSVFSWSYRSLGEPAARMFRLIGVHPGPDLTAAAAASLAALPAASAAALLRELVRVNLLTEKAPGRFEPHDLLRVYAAELAGDDPVARRRILDHYAVTAYDAQRIVNRTRRPFPRIVPGPGVGPETPADPASATAWFAAEKGVLRAAVAMAARHGLDEHAFVMSFSMSPFFKRQGGRDLAAAMAEAALGAAERLGDRMMTGRVLGWQAGIHGDAGDVTAAERGFARAIVIFTELGDQEHLMSVHEAVIVMLAGHGRFEEIYTRSERLLALARGIGDDSRVASALNSLAYAAVELGRYENALPPAQESLEIFLRLDLPRDAGGSLDTIGHVQAHLGALEAAAESFERSLELFRAVDERTYMADVLDHLAEVRARLGDPAAARTAWETALTYDDAMRPALAAAIREKLAAL